jgi:hypothetical protein
VPFSAGPIRITLAVPTQFALPSPSHHRAPGPKRRTEYRTYYWYHSLPLDISPPLGALAGSLGRGLAGTPRVQRSEG